MSIQSLIESKVQAALTPVHLEVINESYMHRVAPGSETHFKLVVVSEQFEGQRLLARHRALNTLLADELAGGVHALALHTLTPAEWQTRQSVLDSPACRGKGGVSA
ncbi:BolA family protein [Oceanisphaera arctica]|uniref:DNA-binding transcriptional regulator BolA n=1 Tax=Oceanisphaera arctica TaxID=641510 RepID=A0A2P5TLB2_9GAMM|nr:BolA/IbaG family iron-sulfur metabolism protein [Oceanisphaera arctica]PPL16080.1 BolA family transcriptional regulator [Oceanisphaera arctica]GHA26507.1 BolA family transcriptional regulator [Oceanisphaera arctica]